MASKQQGKTSKSRNPNGRPKGTPNKSTTLAREAIARFVDGNADKLQEWLEQIAEQEGPLKAFQCFTDVIEYHVPKLARHEGSGENGEHIFKVTWEQS